ncbi:hypothetical protein J6TS2_49260 [Heyndrickxia sporothermodurans]|nr:hypothetical protein J6TS2_49260 [Heyndrickxia sporothermodurans]
MNETNISNALHQKVKEMEQKIKEKAYYVKNNMKQSISKAKFHYNKKLNRVGYCVSIATALLIITVSWSNAIIWLFWIGVLSIISNALLLIIYLIKK